MDDRARVRRVQDALIALDLYEGAVDGVAGPKTTEALIRLAEQKLSLPEAKSTTGTGTMLFPMSPQERSRIFGAFDYAPRAGRSKLPISILGDWEEINIVRTSIPELRGVLVDGKPFGGYMRLHRLAAVQIQSFFRAVAAAGLIGRIVSFDGSFCARYTIGGKSLSNHSWGTAFDVNCDDNGYGAAPAPKGHRGSVVELVPIAEAFGLYWGGNFSTPDGMHFEVARLL